MLAATAPAAAAVLALAGCGSQTDMLHPHAPPARDVASLWWWLLGGCSFGLLFVTGLLVLAWIKRRSSGPGREPAERAGWVVVLTLGVGVMVTGLIVLFVVGDIFVARATEAPAAGSTAFTIRAVGRQWYWEFHYPRGRVVSPDELHIPVRTNVRIDVGSDDVIHSFWVPELNRKIDAIPGQRNAIELYADTPGVYRGECIQYCGLQHAHMGFLVVADPPARYRAWLTAQAKPARAANGSARRGEQVFLQGPCASCHTVRGTPAEGYIGPDLTHLASRSWLAGLVIRNTRANLSRWIVDSQSIKPGNQMPNIELTPAQLREVVDYLETLK